MVWSDCHQIRSEGLVSNLLEPSGSNGCPWGVLEGNLGPFLSFCFHLQGTGLLQQVLCHDAVTASRLEAQFLWATSETMTRVNFSSYKWVTLGVSSLYQEANI